MIYHEVFLSAREIQRYRIPIPKGIIHSASVSVPMLYSVFRYLTVPPVASKYRNTEFHSVLALLICHVCKHILNGEKQSTRMFSCVCICWNATGTNAPQSLLGIDPYIWNTVMSIPQSPCHRGTGSCKVNACATPIGSVACRVAN